MKIKICILIFTISLFFPQKRITAQITFPKFEYITTQQGLTSNRINSMIQDSLGFLWIATNNGLNRFDGLDTRQYIHQPSVSNSLADNAVLSLYCDKKGQVWILNLNSLLRYNERNDNFDCYLFAGKNVAYREENRGMITEDNSGNIWAGTPTNGIYCFNVKENRLIKVLPEIKSVSAVFIDSSNTLWIGAEDGKLISYRISDQKANYFQIPEALQRKVFNNYVWKIWQDVPEKINLFLTCGFFEFEIQEGVFRLKDKLNGLVDYTRNDLRVLFNDNRQIWVGVQGKGLYIADVNSSQSKHLQTDKKDNTSLINNSVTSILKDRDGVYWVATKDGLCKYDPSLELFARYQNDPDNPESLHYNFVSSFCQAPDGNIWIGTFGQGIGVFNRSNKTFSVVAHNPGNPRSLVNNTVRALVPDKNGTIWIGTVDGLSACEPISKRCIHYRKTDEPGSISSNDILSLLITRDNRLFVGTFGNGVSVAHIDSVKIKGFNPVNPSGRQLITSKVRKMVELKNGTIAFGTLGDGIYFMCKDSVRSLLPSQFSKNSMSDYVNAVYEDNDKQLWIGTFDGLFRFDSTYNFIELYNTNNGLPSGEINGILADETGEIWVSSMNSLSRIIKVPGKNCTIINYSTKNGLQGSYFTSYSTLKTSDGELYFGGQNGFNCFYPKNIPVKSQVPKVIFTDFQIFNKEVPVNQKVLGRILLNENITVTRKIVLNYKHGVIGFRFAAMTTSKNDKVRYAVKMEGVDPDWVYLNFDQRYISYNNLNAGDYILKVKACNPDGVWSDAETKIMITALPPFWKTWWAYLGYFLLLAGLVSLIIYFIMMRSRLKNQAMIEHIQREKDAEINNLKIKFFINISHEFRILLSLIVSPLERLLKSTEPNPEKKRHLNTMYSNTLKLMNLNNQLLDFRKIETGNIHIQVAPYNIVEFVKNACDSFNEIVSNKNILITSESNTNELIVWFDPDNMGKILYNLLNNAYKFTNINGTIRVTTNHFPEKEKYEILIYNTGAGIEAENLEKIYDRFYQADIKGNQSSGSLGWGIGLSIVKSLVSLHEGTITATSVPNEYAQFKLEFKTGYRHLENNIYITVSENPQTFLPELHNEILTGDEQTLTQPAIDNSDLNTGEKETKILIVEDNTEIRYYLRIALQTHYEVLEAENGKVGCDSALLFIPDLIVTDVIMPHMNGIELCKKIKNNDLTKHIPIIILSAKNTIDDMVEGLETGADDYIPKPFNEKILLVKIQTLLLNRKKMAEKFSLLKVSDQKNINKDLPEFEDQFLNSIIRFIENNLSDSTLGIEKIEQHFRLNKMQIYRKLKAITGLSLNNLIKEIRVKRAKEMLSGSEYNISEIAYELGFNDPLYFSKFFKNEVGVAPKFYRRNG